jgi:hypothetical protein
MALEAKAASQLLILIRNCFLARPPVLDAARVMARYKMVGNSVVPAVAEYVARGCKAVLTEDALALAT